MYHHELSLVAFGIYRNETSVVAFGICRRKYQSMSFVYIAMNIIVILGIHRYKVILLQ
jgi:hypothetical protein